MLGFQDIKQEHNDDPIIKVIGIGGGGGNAINRMVSSMAPKPVEFIAANTDVQDLKKSNANFKLQLGISCTKGLGAGAKPAIGKEAALENSDLIREYVAGADMVFITAGMGGGTGTGGAPIIAKIAREEKALTVGVVTLPFMFEGKQRTKNALKGVEELREHVDTLIVIPNNNLLALANKRTSMVEAFHMADDVLRQAIEGISNLITDEGIINLDFADIKTVMKDGGKAVMGAGAASGDNRAIIAAKRAIESPLLNDCKITGAKGILVNMVGSRSLSMHEVNSAAMFIQEQAHEDATIIWGASIQEDCEDEIRITVIATGFEEQQISEANVQQKSLLKVANSAEPKKNEVEEQESEKDKINTELKNDSLPSEAVETSTDEIEPINDKISEEIIENGESEEVGQSLNILPEEPTDIDLLSEEEVYNEMATIGIEEAVSECNTDVDQVTNLNKNSLATFDIGATHRYPNWSHKHRNKRDFANDLDIPAFIRRRSKKSE